jgi:hypothetical protein
MIATVVGKKRKSTASSSSGVTSSVYVIDDIVVDRGRKPKLKPPKTQSRNFVENSALTVERQTTQHPHRSGKKGRSKSRESRERTRKHPLSETTAPGEKSGVNTESAGSFAAAELIRIKQELDVLKKVRRYSQIFVCVC